MKREIKNSKIKSLMNSAWSYWVEQQYNIFRTYQLAKFGCLLLTGAIFLVFIHNTLTQTQWTWYLSLTSAYFLPPAGKESIIPLALNRGIPAITWYISIIVFDILVSFTIITNWWLIEAAIEHFTLISKYYNKIQKRTQQIESKKYGVLLPLILILFMIIPFQGSGAMTSTVLGRLLGFNRKEILAMVLLGSLIITTIITLVAIKIFTVIS